MALKIKRIKELESGKQFFVLKQMNDGTVFILDKNGNEKELKTNQYTIVEVKNEVES